MPESDAPAAMAWLAKVRARTAATARAEIHRRVLVAIRAVRIVCGPFCPSSASSALREYLAVAAYVTDRCREVDRQRDDEYSDGRGNRPPDPGCDERQPDKQPSANHPGEHSSGATLGEPMWDAAHSQHDPTPSMRGGSGLVWWWPDAIAYSAEPGAGEVGKDASPIRWSLSQVSNRAAMEENRVRLP